MKLKLLIVGLLISYFGYSQSVNIEWVTVNNPKASIYKVFQINGKSFNGLSTGKGDYNLIVSYKDLAYSSTSSFKSVVDGSSPNDEGTFQIGSKIYNITSIDNDDKTSKSIYAHEYNVTGEKAEIEGKKIASFSYILKNKKKLKLGFLASENKQKFCLVYYSSVFNESTSKNGCYGYIIFNSDLTVESKGVFEDTFEEIGENISEYKLTNQGDLFLATKTPIENELPITKVYKVSGNEISQLDLNLKDKFINQVKIVEDEQQNLIFTGFYGEKSSEIQESSKKNQEKSYHVLGIFYTIIDPTSKEILNFGIHELDAEFIFNKNVHGDLENKNLKERKRDLGILLKNFQMKYFEATDDGGYIGISEDIFSVGDYSNPPHYTWYFKDIIVFKFNQNGELQWEKKIRKTQRSMQVYQSSFVVKQIGGKVFIVFNDNKNNYDKTDNMYLNPEDPEEMFGLKGYDAIAVIEINSKNGEIKRNAINVDPEIILIPNWIFFDNENSCIAICKTADSKEMIGRITLKD
jgi:hypothetical protein